ncbi:unnamed protein product [Bursaphelenchus okinawaensis]|uniref:Uncharacterized protein n=1 Tax=Bursaphelenchus okinawaensis TaxID=465554 RepID=A0A811JS40_9BILA|nr:unnamed protein product [Bursaphelenchus okinawaensis]CAG9079980.1 unnamed protein product [Bursaphelenchus okinawaensis]
MPRLKRLWIGNLRSNEMFFQNIYNYLLCRDYDEFVVTLAGEDEVRRWLQIAPYLRTRKLRIILSEHFNIPADRLIPKDVQYKDLVEVVIDVSRCPEYFGDIFPSFIKAVRNSTESSIFRLFSVIGTELNWNNFAEFYDPADFKMNSGDNLWSWAAVSKMIKKYGTAYTAFRDFQILPLLNSSFHCPFNVQIHVVCAGREYEGMKKRHFQTLDFVYFYCYHRVYMGREIDGVHQRFMNNNLACVYGHRYWHIIHKVFVRGQTEVECPPMEEPMQLGQTQALQEFVSKIK